MSDNQLNSNSEGTLVHFRHYAREWTMQFLFQYDLSEFENIETAIKSFSEEVRDSDFFNLPDMTLFKRTYKDALRLITGILENLETIDKQIMDFSENWTIDRMDFVDRNIMRIAVYEMLFNLKVPPIVSINEAVELGKKYGSPNTGPFINGILNSVKNTLQRSAREAVK